MKNQLYILLISLFCLSTTSCKKDFLQRDPGVPISGDDVFGDPVLASRYADNAYNYMLNDYLRLDGNGNKGTTGEFTDEAVFAGAPTPISAMNTGNFLNTGATDVAPVYARMYQGIRVINTMLSKVNQVPWTSAQNPSLIKAQMYFLRGMYYFELVKRFGGVILLDKPLSVNDETDLPRNTYDETVGFILKDLQSAEQILTTESFGATYSPANDWDDGDYGRITIGSVKALRSRLLLLDASPLHNPSGAAAKWQKAADAAKAIISMGKYSLQADYATLLNVPSSPEYILISIRPPRPFIYLSDHIMSPGSGGAQGQLNPTQNHVDLYEMSNGKPITDPTSGYNPQQPYANRDPRFYANILYNDAPWQGRNMQMYDGGTDYRSTAVTYTRTGYYTRKLWPEVYKAGSTSTALINFIVFRYGEVLLNYAEALNEAQGPVADVYTYINQIRARAGMPALPTGLTKDQMRARIHNERAVELAFEELRWWDLLRWKDGENVVAKTVNGMNVVKSGASFTYTVQPLSSDYQRVFRDNMYLYPIPLSEIQKSNGALVQNPGW
ncbi:hypothetical protein ABIB40_002726 [Pedobacter sp. UYP30]|uniref:RagB/SusD family nutrient uptake outer membrane protein n=1 Tax=Pedobacter sp. UYP30 TaxID=1756400 RepID=UPI0033947B00